MRDIASSAFLTHISHAEPRAGTNRPHSTDEQAVISTKLFGGRTVVHVYAESSPGAEFEAVEPDMKDVYFSVLTGHHPSAGSGRAGRRVAETAS